MEKNNVLDLVVGLDCEQVETFHGLVFPVLRVLRENIKAGQPTMCIDLESVRANEQVQKAGVVSSRSTKGN